MPRRITATDGISTVRLCVSFCPHDKTAETKITKLHTEMIRHDTLPTHEY